MPRRVLLTNPGDFQPLLVTPEGVFLLMPPCEGVVSYCTVLYCTVSRRKAAALVSRLRRNTLQVDSVEVAASNYKLSAIHGKQYKNVTTRHLSWC